MRGYHKPCESLNGAWETGSHTRVRGGCHVSTFPGRGVTFSKCGLIIGLCKKGGRVEEWRLGWSSILDQNQKQDTLMEEEHANWALTIWSYLASMWAASILNEVGRLGLWRCHVFGLWICKTSFESVFISFKINFYLLNGITYKMFWNREAKTSCM